MLKSSSSENSIFEYYYDGPNNMDYENIPNYSIMGQPLLYYAQVPQQNPPFANPKSRQNRSRGENCFQKAFRWYTREHVPVKDNLDIGFASWLDEKYVLYLQENRDANCVCPSTQHTNESRPNAFKDCCVSKKKNKKRFKSPWKKRRCQPYLVEGGDKCKTSENSLKFILQPKDDLQPTYAQNEQKTDTSYIKSNTSVVSFGVYADEIKTKSRSFTILKHLDGQHKADNNNNSYVHDEGELAIQMTDTEIELKAESIIYYAEETHPCCDKFTAKFPSEESKKNYPQKEVPTKTCETQCLIQKDLSVPKMENYTNTSKSITCYCPSLKDNSRNASIKTDPQVNINNQTSKKTTIETSNIQQSVKMDANKNNACCTCPKAVSFNTLDKSVDKAHDEVVTSDRQESAAVKTFNIPKVASVRLDNCDCSLRVSNLNFCSKMQRKTSFELHNAKTTPKAAKQSLHVTATAQTSDHSIRLHGNKIDDNAVFMRIVCADICNGCSYRS